MNFSLLVRILQQVLKILYFLVSQSISEWRLRLAKALLLGRGGICNMCCMSVSSFILVIAFLVRRVLPLGLVLPTSLQVNFNDFMWYPVLCFYSFVLLFPTKFQSWVLVGGFYRSLCSFSSWIAILWTCDSSLWLNSCFTAFLPLQLYQCLELETCSCPKLLAANIAGTGWSLVLMASGPVLIGTHRMSS